MGKKTFRYNQTTFDKSELLGRMCRVGVAHWGRTETQKTVLLEQELSELKVMAEWVAAAIRVRRKQLGALRRYAPTPKQQAWDEARIERTVFFLSTDSTLEEAAADLGISRETLHKSLTTSLKLLERREVAAEQVAAGQGDAALPDDDDHLLALPQAFDLLLEDLEFDDEALY